MRRIIKAVGPAAAIVNDDWIYPGQEATEASDEAGRVVLKLADFLAARQAGKTPVGVQLAPADAVEDLAPHLAGLELVCVEFTNVGEGRGYTQARLLRERYGYRGELRSVGAAKRDHVYFLARCGFDAFDLPPTEDLDDALLQLQRFTVAYQRTTGAIVHPSQRALPTREARS